MDDASVREGTGFFGQRRLVDMSLCGKGVSLQNAACDVTAEQEGKIGKFIL
jgi:hypothetical protein